MFAVTAGFHRYFAHRTYKLGRSAQFLLALLAQTAAQKGVLWWASLHRHHHRYSDLPEDVHSPLREGFWWSHIGWILSGEYDETDLSRVPDLARYAELRWLDRNQYLATLLYATAMALVFGPVGLFYGYFLSTALLWHGTFSINSVMHVFGRRAFETSDGSRNSFLFAVLTMGEGWHNNHHRYPGSAAQGLRWWQIDASFYLLWIAERMGVVRGLRRAPARWREATARVIRGRRARFDVALELANDRMAQRIAGLSERWGKLKDLTALAAHQALNDYDRRREAAALRLATLEASYAAAVKRLEAATGKHVEELRTEIDQTRSNLLSILETLVLTAETLRTARPL
ncbi:MAG: fatty acid desaturase [Acidobacteria bacterium]|nr:fatty acid desaturase [Acidobacteriota bacterium]